MFSKSTKIKSLRETATLWFIRMQHAELDHPDRGRFEAWLMASPAHAAEYSAVADVWQSFNSTQQLQSLSSAIELKRYSEKQIRHQKAKTAAVKVFSVLFAVSMSILGLSNYQSWYAQPVLKIAASTSVGQQGERLLEDGSKLIINANSDVQVVYYRDKRMVKLSRGEVIFEVSKDTSRPFIVDSGQARITVLGTRFAVNRLNKLIRVSVDHGSVKVESHEASSKVENAIVLHDGEVAEIKGDARPERIYRDAADGFNFRQGILNFDQAELDEIAETMSRYRTPPITARLMHQHNPQITAVVKVQEIESFLESLHNIAAVKVKAGDHQTILIAQPQE